MTHKTALPFGLKAIALLLLVTGLLATAHPAFAQTRLVLVAPHNSADTTIGEVIIRAAYKRLGIDVEIRKYPGERALRLADSGKVDGEVHRIDGISGKYKNLVQIKPPINFIKGTAFSDGLVFPIKGWQSLKPYRIGYILGIKFAENNTRGMKSVAVSDYGNMFQLLGKDRIDVVVSPRINGLYQMRMLGIKNLKELTPPIAHFDLFHYLHKKNQHLVPKITAVLQEMAANGELTRIRDHAIQVILDRADKGLAICDTDYACFEEK
jgi:polar amino acid transport system substrate-binding protein